MPTQKLRMEGKIEGQGRIRKRGCSSSSSSSLVRNYRLKRAILVGKRGGSGTPVPTWKMSSRSPSLNNEKSMLFPVKGGGRGKEVALSARKLAATLWEISELPSPKGKEIMEEKRTKMEIRSKERILKDLSDPFHSPVSERMDRLKEGSGWRRISIGSQKLLTDYNVGKQDYVHSSSLMEIGTQAQGRQLSGNMVGIKDRLKNISNGLATSKELLKVLSRIWCLEDKHSTGLSLVSALKVELSGALIQVNRLIEEKQSNSHEIDYLLKQFEKEKATWKLKERNRINKAVSSIAGQLKVEKMQRRQTERLNQKLSKELADTKASLSKAVEERESDRRARETLEQVCEELAKGIGEDRAEVEELKREAAKVHEEVEKEREMLQLADLLREERVQMKLSEAKYQLEEKNAAVDKLRSELETYLKTKLGKDIGDSSTNYDRVKELEDHLTRTLPSSCHNGDKENNEGEVVNGEEGNDSEDSDLHSIELNMDNNNGKYEWSHAFGVVAQNALKSNSVDDKMKGRKSISSQTRRKGISFERRTSDGIEWKFGSKENSDGLYLGRLSELASQALKKSCEDEMDRDNMIKDLRDHLVFGSGLETSPGSVSLK